LVHFTSETGLPSPAKLPLPFIQPAVLIVLHLTWSPLHLLAVHQQQHASSQLLFSSRKCQPLATLHRNSKIHFNYNKTTRPNRTASLTVLTSNKRINCMEQSPSEANSHSASFYRTKFTRARTNRCIHSASSHPRSTGSVLILLSPSMPVSSKWSVSLNLSSQNFVCISHQNIFTYISIVQDS